MFVNVKDPPYRAVGDGITNAAAIDAAVAAVVAAGGAPSFSEGQLPLRRRRDRLQSRSGIHRNDWLEGQGVQYEPDHVRRRERKSVHSPAHAGCTRIGR